MATVDIIIAGHDEASAAIGGVARALDGLASAASGLLGAGDLTGGDVFGGAGAGMAEGVAATMAALAEAWQLQGEQMAASVSAVFEGLGVTVAGGLESLRALMGEGLLQLSAEWLFGWGQLGFGLEIFFLTLAALTALHWEALKLAWAAGFAALASSVQAAVPRILGEFQALGGQMVALGRAIIDGLMQGLREKMDELFALARRIAARVRETLEDALRIGSPSQVMADIGRAMMEGWQVGIERGADRPASALERASGAVVGHVGGAQSLASLPGGGSSGALTINLYAEVLDESAAARVFDALESEARRRGLSLAG